MNEGYINRGARRIAWYRDAYSSAHTPLLAIHGGPGYSHGYMRPYLSCGLDRSVVYFDLAGSGRSSRHPGSGYPMEEYLFDTEAVRVATIAAPAVLLGHGWGAILAVECALRFPQTVSAVILVNPIRILRGEGQDHEAQARRVAAVDPQLIEPYIQQVYPKIQRALGGELAAWEEVDRDPWWARIWRTQFMAPLTSEQAATIDAMRWGMESYFAHKGAVFLNPEHAMAQYDLAGRVQQLLAPLGVIATESDANYVSPWKNHAAPIVAARPGIESAIMPNVGHYPFMEQSAKFAEHLQLMLHRLGV